VRRIVLAAAFVMLGGCITHESANVYDSLGDGLLAMGDTTAATTQFRRAVEVARRTGHGVFQESQRKLKALEASRAEKSRGH